MTDRPNEETVHGLIGKLHFKNVFSHILCLSRLQVCCNNGYNRGLKGGVKEVVGAIYKYIYVNIYEYINKIYSTNCFNKCFSYKIIAISLNDFVLTSHLVIRISEIFF